MEGEPTTVAIQATIKWEAGLALVALQEGGLGVHLHVDVCCYYFTCMHVHGRRGRHLGSMHSSV